MKPANAPQSPAFPVVMAVYNAREYISAAIESVLAQTLIDFELICAGRLRWRDFGLRGFNMALRIYRALEAARRERKKEPA